MTRNTTRSAIYHINEQRELWAYFWPLGDGNKAVVSAAQGGVVETLCYEIQLTAQDDEGRLAEILAWIKKMKGIDIELIQQEGANYHEAGEKAPILGYKFRLVRTPLVELVPG